MYVEAGCFGWCISSCSSSNSIFVGLRTDLVFENERLFRFFAVLTDTTNESGQTPRYEIGALRGGNPNVFLFFLSDDNWRSWKNRLILCSGAAELAVFLTLSICTRFEKKNDIVLPRPREPILCRGALPESFIVHVKITKNQK